MRSEEVKGLIEAYSKVYASSENFQEEIQEWANSLIEEGYNLSEYTSDELYEAYIEEVWGAQRYSRTGPSLSSKLSGAFKSGADSTPRTTGIYGQPTKTPAAKPVKPATTPAAAKPAAAPAAAKPAAAPAKPTATSSAKPTTTPAAKPAGSAMDQWAKANPKLAAAKAERDRTRGTSATSNPLMKDMKSNLPAPKSEDVDIFDLVKGYLLDEGYAETEEGAMVMMVNMSEEWRESILEVLGGQSGDGYIGHPRLGIKNPMSAPKKPVTSAPKNTGVAGQLGNRAAAMDAAMKQLRNSYEAEGEQLDEISTKLAGKVVNARIERTGAAADRENKARTPQNVRDTVAAADKESRAKKLAAGVRKRRSATNEQLEAWVEELTAEGYDLSGYTQEEIAEIYAQELELAEAQHARENPEGHDKEEKKKYEKVRGEKTPMPPRGDKRREDFEKWYAANVR
jgi:hypothetical protein